MRLPMSILFAFLGASFLATARADSETPDPSTEPPGSQRDLQACLAGGYLMFDKTLPFDNAVTAALSVRQRVASRIQLKGEIALTPTEDDAGRMGAVSQLSIGARYRLFAGRPFTPYAEAGVGWAGFYGFGESDDVVCLDFGVGIEQELSTSYSIFGDLRGQSFIDAFGGKTKHGLRLGVGLSARL